VDSHQVELDNLVSVESVAAELDLELDNLVSDPESDLELAPELAPE